MALAIGCAATMGCSSDPPAASGSAGAGAATGVGGATGTGGDAAGGAGGGTINQGVDVIRDEHGTPHVYAADLAGAMYGLGWATAQDRLLQIELKRRYMRGRMAEVFGRGGQGEWLDIDRRSRTIGFGRHADTVVSNLPGDTTALLTAYAEGVNAYVERDDFVLPADFATANIAAFEPWSAADSLLAWSYTTARFGGDAVAGEIANETKVPDPNEICPGGVLDEEAAVVPNPMQASMIGPDLKRDEAPFKASHSWVIAGWRNSAGDAAVLHSNPQLPVMAPSFLYEYHLSTPELDVRGGGFSGTPGFLVMFNRNIAQGGSAAGGDAGDLFKITVNGSNYVLDGADVPLVTINETIAVSGEADVELTVRETGFGPLVTELMDNPDGEYAFKHVEFSRADSHSVVGAIGMMRASNLDEYRQAIVEWAEPCLHTIYGDNEGNIAYQPSCRTPKRATDINPTPGEAPFDGTLSSQDWNGVLTVDEMPHVINPPEGYIFTANHMAVGAWYPHYLHMDGSGDTTRSHRLRTIFSELLPSLNDTMTPEQVRSIQDDAGSESVRIFTKALRALDTLGQLPQPSGAPATEPEKAWAVLQALQLWGGDANTAVEAYPGAQQVTSDPIFPLVLRLSDTTPMLFRKSYPELACTFGGGEPGLANFQKAFDADPSAYLSDPNNPLHISVRNYHVQTAAKAYDAVMTNLPADPTQWTPTTFTYHVQHQFNFLCMGTPNCNFEACTQGAAHDCSLDDSKTFTGELYAPAVHSLRSQKGNCYSHWVDLDDVDSALSLAPPGVSEQPNAATFDSALEAWENGEMRSAVMTREVVEPGAMSVESLEYNP